VGGGRTISDASTVNGFLAPESHGLVPDMMSRSQSYGRILHMLCHSDFVQPARCRSLAACSSDVRVSIKANAARENLPTSGYLLLDTLPSKDDPESIGLHTLIIHGHTPFRRSTIRRALASAERYADYSTRGRAYPGLRSEAAWSYGPTWP
jgi:hypothetical protein